MDRFEAIRDDKSSADRLCLVEQVDKALQIAVHRAKVSDDAAPTGILVVKTVRHVVDNRLVQRVSVGGDTASVSLSISRESALFVDELVRHVQTFASLRNSRDAFVDVRHQLRKRASRQRQPSTVSHNQIISSSKTVTSVTYDITIECIVVAIHHNGRWYVVK